LGGSIYLFLRESTYFSEFVLKYDRLFIVETIRNHISILNNWFIKLLKYNMVDGLWVYSLLWTIYLFVVKKTLASLVIVCFFSLAFGVLIEILQFYNIIKGTFDIFDILIYLLSVIFAFLIIKRSERLK